MTNWYTCTISWSSQSCQSVILTRIINALWTRTILILLEINFYGSFAGSKLLVLHPCGLHLNVWGPFRGGDVCPYNYSSEFQNPLFQGLRRRLCPCWYYTINYYCIFHCSWRCHSRNPFWCHLSTFQLSYDVILRSCHLRFFPQQGLIYATLYISLIFKMGKWPISLTNMIIVAISLFSLNIFLNCFIGPMRKQVL